MGNEMNEPQGQVPKHNMMEIFNELSFKKKWQKVFNGLKQEKDSGDYKYAKFQLLRLFAPASAIIVPCIAVTLLALFASMAPPPITPVEIIIIDPDEVEKLDEIEDLEPPEPPEMTDMDFTTPDVTVDMAVPMPETDFSPQPAEFDSVAIVKSPLIMKGIYGSRNPGARGSALGRYGGGMGKLTEGAVLRALRWLKKHQDEDGSWTTRTDGGEGGYNGAAPAMTGLALLAYLAHGETPASEEFGLTVEKAIRWIVDNQKSDGRFKGKDGNDYCHPIAAYAISEAYGLTKIPMIKEVAEKSIDAIIKGQHASGGWNYNCNAEDRDDTSYMAWCAQALKAAKMAGLENSGLKQAMRKAIQGFKKNAAPGGGFGYTKPGTGGLTGAGTLCMQLLGASREVQVRQGLAWLEKHATCDWKKPWGARPIYYWYYVTQAKFHQGGETWDLWNKLFAIQLVKNQHVLKNAIMGPKDRMVDIGYWEPPWDEEKKIGRVYNTTLCTLMLEVYYRYLPTFQAPEEIEMEEEIASEDDIEIEISI